MTPSLTPSSMSQRARIADCRSVRFSGVTTDALHTLGFGNVACELLIHVAAHCVKEMAGAAATMPSKSSGYRCASIKAWRPPFEQPRK